MRAISAVVGVVALLAAVTSAQESGKANPSLLKAAFAKLPIHFIENRGVCPDEVAYYVKGAYKTLFFTNEGITFRLKGKDRGWVVKLEFVGANREVVPRAEDRQQAVFSYFKGPEQHWKTGLRTYAKLVYENLWPGIDLVYRGTDSRLKYEFVVKQGADPGKIKLRYRGATKVEVTGIGGLRVETPAGNFEDEPPVAWQDIQGKRTPVETAIRRPDRSDRDGHVFGFQLGDYDRSLPLIVDPAILVYCGYVGGGRSDSGYGIAVDAAGNAYVTGRTDSDEDTFPLKVGPDLTYNGGSAFGDVFVAKVSASGKTLVYCGYIGGCGNGWGVIAVDAAGNAYVTGSTGVDEKTFPVKVGPDLTFNGRSYDAFVAKVNAQGTALVYCGYIGGSGNEWGMGIAVDAAGNAYVTGLTESDQNSFPVTIGPDLTHNGSHFDAFVAKVNAQGTALTYCGYIGGIFDDYGGGIAVDGAGNAYVCGETWSTQATFPVKVGPDLTSNGRDAFVAKVNAQGTALVYCGYIGGAGGEYGYSIAVDTAGSAYVTGITSSNQQTFPVKVGPNLTYSGGPWGDAFVAKVDARGTGFDYCGYIGGSGSDAGYGIAVDAGGNAYVTGNTNSNQQTFPVKVGPDRTFNGGPAWGDAFVAKVNRPGTAFVYCGYIGGSGEECGQSIAVDAAANAYVTGITSSDQNSLPVRVGPDRTHNGGTDAFVAKIEFTQLEASGTPRPNGTIRFNLTATNGAGLPFQLGTSLGTGPILIGTRQIDLSPDPLLLVSVSDLWPWIFSGYRGVMDSKGRALAAIHIPNVPALIGVRLHSAFVTLDPAAPSGIRSISNTFSFSITK